MGFPLLCCRLPMEIPSDRDLQQSCCQHSHLMHLYQQLKINRRMRAIEMGNFGKQVQNCFRGILLSGNLFVTADVPQFCIVGKEIPRASTDIWNGNMPFKVLGMTSLLSLPPGIVLHPFCGSVLVCMPSHCIGGTFIDRGEIEIDSGINQAWHQAGIQTSKNPLCNSVSIHEQFFHQGINYLGPRCIWEDATKGHRFPSTN